MPLFDQHVDITKYRIDPENPIESVEQIIENRWEIQKAIALWLLDSPEPCDEESINFTIESYRKILKNANKPYTEFPPLSEMID